MRKEQWFTIAGASTLIAGTVVAIGFSTSKLLTVFSASTAGVAGTVLLIQRQRPSTQSPSKTDRTENSLSHLEALLQQNHNELAAELRAMRQPSSSSPVIREHRQTFETVEPFIQKINTELTALTAQLHQQRLGNEGTKRTAILYDIENLLKGYNISQEILTSLSLKEILNQIRQTGKIGHILVQQAYANWSDSRLKIMRGEINELGIDPIQVFGFSREPKKNAADIELAISAIDLAYIRPSIEVFVIVSGDGGFAALAKKLHEYGKTVIGCAYQNSASKTFRSVCDEFIWITDPDEEERSYQTGFAAQGETHDSSFRGSLAEQPIKKKSALLSSPLTPDAGTTPELDADKQLVKSPDSFHPFNIALLEQLNLIKQRHLTANSEILEAARSILNLYLSYPQSQAELSRLGLELSIVNQAIRYSIPDLKTKQFGFLKFIEFMQYLCQGTEFCIARISSSKVILALRNAIPEHIKILPDLSNKDNRTQKFQPLNHRLLPQLNEIKQAAELDSAEPLALTQMLLNLYATHLSARSELLSSGISLSVVQQAINYILPDLKTIQFGFAKFIEYMQYACQASDLCIARIPPSKVVLVLRQAPPEQASLLPDLERRDVHSLETYQSILANGSPTYRLPSPDELYALTQWIAENPIEHKDLGTAIEDVVTGLNGEIASEVVKLLLLSFVSADLFLREPEEVHLSEQFLSLKPNFRTLEDIMTVLKSAVREKLLTVLPEVKSDLLEDIFPDVEGLSDLD